MISKISDVIRIGFTYDTPTWFTIMEETTQYLETSMIDEFDENSLLVTNPNAINVYEDYTIQMHLNGIVFVNINGVRVSNQ